MSKKKKAKTRKSIQANKAEPAKNAVSENNELNENPFDFGGLPNRDLKKNLGCG